ncbi:MAG: LacI family DNA-binding transcriptional regulator [Propionicimonas sp.]|nr:LacI family DNA-binding transcriptional regulator [Propionicimonas sp.]
MESVSRPEADEIHNLRESSTKPRGFTERVTIRAVAEASGVSIATASKALKGGYRVSAETTAKVRRVADLLNYAPNPQAQSLHTGRTGTVGMIAGDLVGRFSIPVMMGAEDAFGSGRVAVFLSDARGDPLRERYYVRALLSRRVDGLIIVGDNPNPRTSLGELPVPVVYAYAPSSTPTDISIISDNVGAGRTAAEHLISLGRARIAYIAGDRSVAASPERVAGAVEALSAHGLQLVGSDALYGSWDESWGRGAIRTLLAAHPDIDAVMCGADQVARGVLDALREMGKRVPEDVAVIGHDNLELLAPQSRPPLTSIDMNLEEVGRLAAQLLFAAVDGDHHPGLHSVPTRLVTRASTLPVF